MGDNLAAEAGSEASSVTAKQAEIRDKWKALQVIGERTRGRGSTSSASARRRGGERFESRADTAS